MKTNQKFITLQDKLCIRFLPTSKNGAHHPFLQPQPPPVPQPPPQPPASKNGFPVGTLMEEDTSEPIATLTSSNNFCKAVSAL